MTDPWSILERAGHVPFCRVDGVLERFSPCERRGDGGGQRASRAVRTANSHARRAKFTEIVAVVKNVYRILTLRVAGACGGSKAPAFYQCRTSAQGTTSACAASRIPS